MIKNGEDLLICDMAETYNIYDYRALPARRAATYAAGLREDSRIKMKLAGISVKQSEFILAVIADEMRVICSALGVSNSGALLTDILLGNTPEADPSEIKAFNTPDDFMKAWEENNDGN